MKSKAQSTLEYTTIAVLVITGILVIGPYLIRSINALFKSLDDGVQDSFMEQMAQGNTFIDVPDCNCDNILDIGCGTGDPCLRVEHRQDRQCNILDCDKWMCAMFNIYCDMVICTSDDTCCYDVVENPAPARCGVNATFPPPQPEVTFMGSTFNCAMPIEANHIPAGTACPDGDLEHFHCCGVGLTSHYWCETDGDCSFSCQGPKSDNATWCTDDTINLPGDVTTTHIDSASDCSATKCEAYCHSGWEPNAAQTTCVPKPFPCYVPLQTSGAGQYRFINDVDRAVGVNCMTGHMAGIRSYFHSPSGEDDRRFAYKCCYADESVSPTYDICEGHHGAPCDPNWGGVGSNYWLTVSSWANNWDEGWGRDCGEGRMVAERSYHNNAAEDRRFEIRCGYRVGESNAGSGGCTSSHNTTCEPPGWHDSEPAGFECGNGWVNDMHEPAVIFCGYYGHLAGEVSYHDNKQEDREFGYKCCYPDYAPDKTPEECHVGGTNQKCLTDHWYEPGVCSNIAGPWSCAGLGGWDCLKAMDIGLCIWSDPNCSDDPAAPPSPHDCNILNDGTQVGVERCLVMSMCRMTWDWWVAGGAGWNDPSAP